MPGPFAGLSKWEKLAFAGIVVAVLGVTFYLSYINPKEPTLEERVKAMEVLLYTDDAIQRHNEEMYQLQEWMLEIDGRTVWDDGDIKVMTNRIGNLEDWVTEVQTKCDQCVRECGGPD